MFLFSLYHISFYLILLLLLLLAPTAFTCTVQQLEADLILGKVRSYINGSGPELIWAEIRGFGLGLQHRIRAGLWVGDLFPINVEVVTLVSGIYKTNVTLGC